MSRKHTAVFLVCAISAALAFAAGFATGQAKVPTETQGQSAVELRSLDLSGELDSVAWRPLRMRKFTLVPGAIGGLHHHKDRPTITYLLEGEVIYHQEGKTEQVVHPGGGVAEGRATTHWVQNRGSVPAV